MSRYVMDLSEPAIQGAVLQYLIVVAETLRRAADAVEAGSAGRERLIEELATARVLLHYLARRLSEPEPERAPPTPTADMGTGLGPDAAKEAP